MTNKSLDLENPIPDLPKRALIQIYIRSLEEKSLCMRVWNWEWIKNLKQMIQDKMGIPASLQNLIYTRKVIQEEYKLQS